MFNEENCLSITLKFKANANKGNFEGINQTAGFSWP